MSALFVDVVEAPEYINSDGQPCRLVQWCRGALAVMMVQPVVEAALLQVLVNKQLGILAGDAAEQLDDVVIDAPESLHLRVEQFVVRISRVAYLLDSHYFAVAVLSATIKARRWTRYTFPDPPLPTMFSSDMLFSTSDSVKSRGVVSFSNQPRLLSPLVCSSDRRVAIWRCSCK